MLSCYLKMSARPKRSVNRPYYRQLADVKVPKTSNRIHRRDRVGSLPDSTLYCLRVLEEDQENRQVKVRYVGYTGEYDEWRKMDEIVTVDQHEEGEDMIVIWRYISPIAVKFCLFEELASRIKPLSSYSLVERLIPSVLLF